MNDAAGRSRRRLLYQSIVVLALPALLSAQSESELRLGSAEEEVVFRGLKVPKQQLLYYERGYRPHEGGWVRASDLPAIERGWTRVDGDYLSPEDLEKHSQGLFKCDRYWFDEADANDYHSIVYRWWRIPHEGFVALSTCSRNTTKLALEWMAYTKRDLMRIFGVAPSLPMTVILLRNLEQYNAFGVTRLEEGRVPPDSSGLCSFHYAYPCEQWLDFSVGGEHPGAACAYWDDRDRAGNYWGPLAVRHAAAHAFIEGIDPSPKAVRAYRRDPMADFPAEDFWAEKRLPLWLRYGAAVYCERFFIHGPATNPHWAPHWSKERIAESGSIGDLETIFACQLSQKEPGRSADLTLRAGLILAFILDGGIQELGAAHASFREAMVTR